MGNNGTGTPIRDWERDRRICDAATEGLDYEVIDGDYVEVFSHYDYGDNRPIVARGMRKRDAEFLYEARTGWSAALDRIAELEEDLRLEREDNEFLREGRDQANANYAEVYLQLDAATSGFRQQFDLAAELIEKNTKLRTALMSVYQAARNDVNRWDGGVCFGLQRFQDRNFVRQLIREIEPLLFGGGAEQ